MKKLSWQELVKIIHEHNKQNQVERQFEDKKPLNCVVVFKDCQKDWGGKSYPLESRSYRFTSDNKRFISGLCGNSIFAESIDKTESIRLDWYLGNWEIDYCYLEN